MVDYFKKIPKYLDIPFAYNFYFCFFKTQDEYNSWKDSNNIKVGIDSCQIDGHIAYVETISRDEKITFCSLVFVDKPSTAILVHELSHMVDEFIESWGLNPQNSNTELRSLIMEWLSEEAFNFYKPKVITTRKK